MLALGAVTANVLTAVLLSEMFPTAVRYTASAITYNVAYALFGGTVPFVATLLIAKTGNSLAPAAYIVLVAVIALVAALSLPDTSRPSLQVRGVAPRRSAASPSPGLVSLACLGAGEGRLCLICAVSSARCW
jgi:MHS family proline/betaine transporter-like MFS transporter